HDDLPTDVDLSRYPRYYRRTFHWQSGGWLTDRSAELYDPGVELLFGYTGDVMRRMALPDVIRSVSDVPAPRIADLACGTGRLLRQLHVALPNARLYGVDLSPNYIKHTRRALAHIADLSLVAENAESLPFTDGFFDGLTMSYLLHELPKDARRNVLSEALRVVRPGGVLAIVASPQYVESGPIAELLDNFPRLYHEPYYKGYLKDPIEEALTEVGFECLDSRNAFLSKVVIARRPQ
ncbi:MAG: ubiquinone/menaquinone biosynthesis C-methylase UbiE, partial [Myxococcota bacterium]